MQKLRQLSAAGDQGRPILTWIRWGYLVLELIHFSSGRLVEHQGLSRRVNGLQNDVFKAER